MTFIEKLRKLKVDSWRASDGLWGYLAVTTPWFVAQFSFQPPVPRRAIDASFSIRSHWS